MSYKLLILGIDGGDWEIIDPLISQGKLPFFAKIKKEGFFGRLISTIPPISAPAWASFQTGLTPGEHGVFDFEDLVFEKRFNLKSKKIVNSESVKGAKFWDYLEREGKKGCFINLPLTYPLPHTTSIVVSSLLTPSGAVYCNDQKVYEYLKRAGYIVDPDPYLETEVEEEIKSRIDEKLRSVFKDVEIKGKIAVQLMKKSFDVFFILFRGSDLLQHLFLGRKEVEEYYVVLDKVLERLVKKHQELFGKKSLVFILSDHGFHKVPKYKFNIFNFLTELGYIQKPEEPQRLRLLRPFYRTVKWFLERGKLKVLVLKLKDKFLSKSLLLKEKEAFLNSQIFPTHFGIYCNEQMRDDLIKKLKSLTYQGKKVFNKVFSKEEIYKGPYLEYAPDIVFLPNKNFLVSSFPFQKSRAIFEKNITHLAGHHTSALYGIIIGKGEPFVKGNIGKFKIESILPTCLHILGLSLNEKLIGRVNKNIFSKTSDLFNSKIKFVSEEKRIRSLINEQFKEL